jgi:hypothetical protein
MQVNAVRTASMRLQLGQYRYQYEIEICVKILNTTKSIVLPESIDQELPRVTMWHEPSLISSCV